MSVSFAVLSVERLPDRYVATCLMPDPNGEGEERECPLTFPTGVNAERDDTLGRLASWLDDPEAEAVRIEMVRDELGVSILPVGEDAWVLA